MEKEATFIFIKNNQQLRRKLNKKNFKSSYCQHLIIYIGESSCCIC